MAGSAKRVAVLGIKTEAKVRYSVGRYCVTMHIHFGSAAFFRKQMISANTPDASFKAFMCRIKQDVLCAVMQANQPAFFVAAYMKEAGVNVVPVPVFFPDVTEILGQKVFRRVQRLAVYKTGSPVRTQYVLDGVICSPHMHFANCLSYPAVLPLASFGLQDVPEPEGLDIVDVFRKCLPSLPFGVIAHAKYTRGRTHVEGVHDAGWAQSIAPLGPKSPSIFTSNRRHFLSSRSCAAYVQLNTPMLTSSPRLTLPHASTLE
eukprot:5124189-Pyramimonas_sp.AAC.1